MDYQAGEITIFKNEEFLLMLAAAGLDRWYGIELTEKKAALSGEREFNRNLASLYQKKIIDWGAEKAHISGPYREMFRSLKDAEKCITVRTDRRSGYIRGCYCSGGNIVTVERRTASTDELELSMRTLTDWMEELEESGCFPVSAGTPEFGDEGSSEAEELVSEFELREASDGALIETMRLYEKGLYGSMEMIRNGSSSTEYFSADRIREVLTEWTGGRK